MRNVVPSRRSCLVFAAFVLAAITFVPVGSFAQDNAAASPDQDLMQNVKAIYFPFNIYSRVVNPDVLQADGDYLKQHPREVWIQGYADIRGDIFYNLVLSYRRAQFVKAKLMKDGIASRRFASPRDGASSIPSATLTMRAATNSSAAWTSCRLTTCKGCSQQPRGFVRGHSRLRIDGRDIIYVCLHCFDTT